MARSPKSWSLEEVLREYPWPLDLAPARPLEYLWHHTLDTSVEALWRQMADTSRFNRALGLPPMQLEERDGALLGRSVNGGVEHRWTELPWSWVSHRWMLSERSYSRGLIRHSRAIFLFEPEPNGAEGLQLYTYLGLVPRGWLARPLLALGMGRLEQKMRTLLQELARQPEEVPSLLVVEGGEPLSAEAAQRLEEGRAQLEQTGFEGEALTRLTRLIAEGDPLELQRLQPRRLAQRWNKSAREVLRLCLHATRAGLLDMSWDVICPHCRGVRSELKNLGEVPQTSSCDACAIEFGTDGSDAIEITFHVHPSIRQVIKQQFCSAQTAGKRHIEIHQVLAPGEERVVETALSPARYRCRIQGSHEVGYLDVCQGDDEAAWRASEAPRVWPVNHAPLLRLHNDSDRPQVFVVERPNWADVALRPAHLFTFQEFHDLFSEQFIGADVRLSVGEQTILFTDIVGSTNLYADRGDPEAFVAVRRHFTEIFAIVDRHGGAVVKTIGDAAMAVFSEGLEALAAAREIQLRFHEREADPPIELRISMNTGVCIAVNLNSGIDYFGNTVNVAAKLQSCAGSGQVVLSPSTLEAPGAAAFLADCGTTLEELTLTLPSLDQQLTVHRWTVLPAEGLPAEGPTPSSRSAAHESSRRK